ncbi:helix-turn-helix transcriptional regulator [Streptomyces chiangmaiensis]|uniref:AAA family ATPase n=1 Tax=Streptomyces chiangmaiensis TaxID=766497 RepID=A0ABU7FTC3_9ACTN|nr:AAA family ATPase [Streptomyces chiangmaiensis]MED7827366.1 AAA family ATPase [Streptomyces chiangmaiensis]
MLRGRTIECRRLDQLLAEARSGHSGTLVISGEPGIGKSALLDYLAGQASGCRLMRAGGVESEMELAFAGLHQLCFPMLHQVKALPTPLRDALGVAFGLRAGDSPDRFLVGMGVLMLFSEVAQEQPLVCLVDDVQWLDQASVQALAFVGRRLLADPVLLVFAAREIDEGGLVGLPEMVLAGIDDNDARSLLASVIGGRLDAQVRDRVVAETHGNPLALLEWPRGLTPAQLAGGFHLPDAWPMASRIEESFLARVKLLPPQTQRLLLTAAAEPVGDVPLLWRAAERLEIGAQAAAPAESAGLLDLGTRVRFRHPLVRSAVYRDAALSDRRAVHCALAEATDPQLDPDRWAWHRARAALGPDEAVASELEQSAERAEARGGCAAAAAFLTRATELTPDPARRTARALAAAQTKLNASAPDAAYELATTAELGPLDEWQHARLERLRGQIAFAQSRGGEAPPLLLHAAKLLEPLDPVLARETYLEAFTAAVYAGRISSDAVSEVAESAQALPASPTSPRPVDLLVAGMATRFIDGYAAAVPPLNRALSAFRREDSGQENGIRWLWTTCRVTPEPVACDLWDDETWYELATRTVKCARDAGTLGVLPAAFAYRACFHVLAGEFAEASALIDEANAIAEATGSPHARFASLVLAAWRGHPAPALELINASSHDATMRGEGRLLGWVGYATAVLYNGLGDYATALPAAQRAAEYDDLGILGLTLVELIEAGVRSGGREAAAAALQRLEERTRASGTEWALGTQACSRALLSDGEAADAFYREAIERLGRSRIAVQLARARLLYGEWLRRNNRRVDARQHLREAYEVFRRMGADAFAERARGELLATGETVRKPTAEPRDALTAQEAHIARLAREGHTNTEIGTQLFISPRTVEWHLHNVFGKLGITSRKELR